MHDRSAHGHHEGTRAPRRCSAPTRRSSRSCTSAISPIRTSVPAELARVLRRAARRRAPTSRTRRSSSRSASSRATARSRGAMVDATHDAQAGARAAADQQVPHARACSHADLDPLQAHARRRTSPTSTSRPTASPTPTWTPSSTSARYKAGPQRMRLRDIVAALQRDLHAHARRRVHVHHRHGDQALGPGAARADPLAARATTPRASAAHPRAPDRGRDARALPAHEVRRPEALLARGRRHDDPDARPADPARGRRRRAARS